MSEGEREKLEKEISARERKYGYKRGDNASLAKPDEYKDIPEGSFADPVGFNYPVGDAHIRPALGYWSHIDHRGAYSDPKARAYITEKIVKTALAKGIQVAWQANDPDYKKLPESLKRRMGGYEGEKEVKAMAFDEIADAFVRYDRGWYEEEEGSEK